MTVSEMAIQSGYACEEYKILTDDGYILTTYRLPGKLSTNTTIHSYAFDENGNPK
jgi:Partial alpha/beta-hydrolase lipase region